MVKGKTGILIIGMVVIILVLLSLQIMFGRNSNKGFLPVIKNEPGSSPNPASSKSNFYLVKTSLDNIKTINLTDGIELTFSKPVTLENFDYTITPKLDLEILRNSSGDVLTFQPKKTWDFETSYQLVIKDNIRSISGEKPSGDIIIDFKVAPYQGT